MQYYQVKVNDSSFTTKTMTGNNAGFYWAGAVRVGSYIYFGGDSGNLYYRDETKFGTTGGVVNP